jgi:hypothetical protein
VFPNGSYILDSYGNGFFYASDEATFYNPTQAQGLLSNMVRPRGCATADDSAYLTPERRPLLKMSDDYDQSPDGFDYSERNVGGVNPLEPYPPGLENIPAPGYPMPQSSIQVPSRIPFLTPRRELVPQAMYGGKANGKKGFNRELPITFAVGDQDGMSLQDAMNEKYERLTGRDDGMFIGCGCTAISLRIQVRTSMVFVPNCFGA